MSRQPYLPSFSRLNYAIGAGQWKSASMFPEIVGKCIGVWTFADNEMGNLFGVLLGAESPATLEVFLQLRRSSNQREALQVAAKHFLKDGREIEVFEALMTLYKSLEAHRNDFAHGCFGVCPTDKTVLFWIDVKDYTHFLVDIIPKLHRQEYVQDPHEMLKKKLFVYRTKDLQTILKEMDEFQINTAKFTSILRRLHPHGDSQLFDQLYNAPQILRERTRLSAGRGNSQ